MSSQVVKQVINQLLTDESFRDAFRADSTAALGELELTDHEKAMLRDLNISEVEESDLVTAHMMDQSAIRVGAVYVS